MCVRRQAKDKKDAETKAQEDAALRRSTHSAKLRAAQEKARKKEQLRIRGAVRHEQHQKHRDELARSIELAAAAQEAAARNGATRRQVHATIK